MVVATASIPVASEVLLTPVWLEADNLAVPGIAITVDLGDGKPPLRFGVPEDHADCIAGWLHLLGKQVRATLN